MVRWLRWIRRAALRFHLRGIVPIARRLSGVHPSELEAARRAGAESGWNDALREHVTAGRFDHIGREQGGHEAARGRVAIAKRKGCHGCLYSGVNRAHMECRRTSISRCRMGSFPRVDGGDWCGEFVNASGTLIPEDFR